MSFDIYLRIIFHQIAIQNTNVSYSCKSAEKIGILLSIYVETKNLH